MLKQLLIFLFIGFVLIGCRNKELNDFKDRYRWIVGKWEGKEGKLQMLETWTWKKNRYEGVAFEIMSGDTIFSEKLFLETHAGFDSYIAVVPKQNPILFTANKLSDKEWSFDNPEHNFPGRIQYGIVSDSVLLIKIMASTKPDDVQLSYELKRRK